ncbi:Ig-like domain-containing protein [Bacteroidales bacterium OttesenSCG-928-B11]|nr:Ig-like domain-containing protein [Bacteroidales bacterium OttesenSCG-928-E04]MDL2308505.1 Ig-like domain-containing protein [Bacteroidales bacterium OttesenSCG-928-C03]MDL2311410.1 Ig-like domain-containing protein [Bacteroidales bacterium OttesenSCG-928-B11]MDL2325806.1 Ig-like domain-containing protein [Bacteroidales bacterium OttesenSCG-928-A14]
MNKNLLIAIALTLLFGFTSCEKTPSVDFVKTNYSLHYDETLQLDVVVENTELRNFQYYSGDENVVRVNSSGLVSGVFVGTTTVEISDGNIADRCKVEVIPYETLFDPPLLKLNILTVEGLKLAEVRNLKSENDNVLIYYPLEKEHGIDSIRYVFTPNDVVTMTAFIKNGITNEQVGLFLQERYLKESNHYFDHVSKAKIYYENREINFLYE